MAEKTHDAVNTITVFGTITSKPSYYESNRRLIFTLTGPSTATVDGKPTMIQYEVNIDPPLVERPDLHALQKGYRIGATVRLGHTMHHKVATVDEGMPPFEPHITHTWQSVPYIDAIAIVVVDRRDQ